MTDKVSELVRLSKYAGGRFDLVQGWGGNASVKLPDKTMLISASGCHLSEVEESSGHVRVDVGRALAVLEDKVLAETSDAGSRRELAGMLMMETVISEGRTCGTKARPSTEMLMHAILDGFTLHSHPIAVNALLCRPGWEAEATRLFPDALCVPYRTPGIEVAIALKALLEKAAKAGGRTPRLAFLENHGLIASSGSLEDTISLTEEVSGTLAAYLGMDLSRYRLCTAVAELVGKAAGRQLVARLVEDSFILRMLNEDRGLFFAPPLSPDKYVYCGPSALELSGPDDADAVSAYMEEHDEFPRVIICEDRLYLLAGSVGRACGMEEVLKSGLMTQAPAGPGARPLAREHLERLKAYRDGQ